MMQNKTQPLPQINKEDIIYNNTAEQPPQGHYGVVRFGTCHGTAVAVKEIREHNTAQAANTAELQKRKEERRKAIEAFRREAEINAAQPHPNITLIIGVCSENPDEIFLVSEKLDGNLESLLLNHKIPLSFPLRLEMAIQCVKGMMWLQRNSSFIHRDLKNSNLLYKSEGNGYAIKICDFGLVDFLPSGEAHLRDSGMTKGTVAYMAPEVMTGQPFNSSIDVFSFGLILWEILCRKRWYDEKLPKRTFMEKVAYDHYRPDLDSPMFSDVGEVRKIPKELQHLMSACWSAKVDDRPKFELILTILENFLAKELIVDEFATKFWLDNFRGDDPSFTTFYQKISQTFNNGEKGANFDHIKTALTNEKSIEKVSKADFGKIVKAFGTPSEGFFKKLREVVEVPGFISAGKEADLHISSSKTEGAYLIRYGSEPGTVSIVANHSGPKAVRIKILDNGFHDGIASYNTFDALMRNQVKTGAIVVPFSNAEKRGTIY